MGNITRYLGVARVYMSLQRHCRNLIFASSNRIVDSGILRRCEIHFYDRCGDPELIHTSPLRPATVVDLTIESDAVWCTRGHTQREMLAVRWLLLRLITATTINRWTTTKGQTMEQKCRRDSIFFPLWV